MPLAFAPLDTAVTITAVRADEKVKKHLTELGLLEGENVTLLSNMGGNVIISVKEGRLCLDRVLASKILVA
ncbi:MAG: ferrous iron transport protein A [Clostridiales bacterium]|nr:ferrous iron transport protein A [Clostridiales bacterium]